MAEFKKSVQLTLKHEGGFVDNPIDRGGPTKFGIRQDDIPGQSIIDITESYAEGCYQRGYWKDLYSDIESQTVADKLFDMGVLLGVGTATKLIQQVMKIDADGLFGDKTLLEINSCDDASLLQAYKVRLVQYVLVLGSEHPDQRVFLNGWIKRINS